MHSYSPCDAEGTEIQTAHDGGSLTRPLFIYGDNKSQVTNSSRPELTLKKKCNSICYHKICELVAMGKSLITDHWTWFNLSDFLTKVTNGVERRRLVGNAFMIYMKPMTSCLRADLEGTEEMCSYARAEGVTLPPLEWETRLNRREKGKDMRSDYIRPYVELMHKTEDERGRHVPGACLTRLSCSSPASVNRGYDRR